MVTTCNLGAGQRSALRRRQSGLVQESIRNVRSALKVTGGAVMFANLKLTVGAMSDLVTRLADPAERARIEALGEEYLPCEPSIETVHHDTLDGVPSVELPLPTVVRNIEQARSEPLPHAPVEVGGQADMPDDVLVTDEEPYGHSAPGRQFKGAPFSSERVTMRGQSSSAKAALPREDGAVVTALDHLALLTDSTAEAAAPVVAISNLEPTGRQGASDNDQQAPRFDPAGFPISLIAAALQSGALAPAPPSRGRGVALLAADEHGAPSVAVDPAPA